MTHTGACACGAVTYQIEGQLNPVSVCHCTTCQAWSGGIFLYFESPPSNVQVYGQGNLMVWKSSDWAERSFCKTCGSSMFFRITAPGPMYGFYDIAAGTLKDWKDIDHIESEIFIDRKPGCYSFEGNGKKITADEYFAQCGGDFKVEK